MTKQGNDPAVLQPTEKAIAEHIAALKKRLGITAPANHRRTTAASRAAPKRAKTELDHYDAVVKGRDVSNRAQCTKQRLDAFSGSASVQDDIGTDADQANISEDDDSEPDEVGLGMAVIWRTKDDGEYQACTSNVPPETSSSPRRLPARRAKIANSGKWIEASSSEDEDDVYLAADGFEGKTQAPTLSICSAKRKLHEVEHEAECIAVAKGSVVEEANEDSDELV